MHLNRHRQSRHSTRRRRLGFVQRQPARQRSCLARQGRGAPGRKRSELIRGAADGFVVFLISLLVDGLGVVCCEGDSAGESCE